MNALKIVGPLVNHWLMIGLDLQLFFPPLGFLVSDCSKCARKKRSTIKPLCPQYNAPAALKNTRIVTISTHQMFVWLWLIASKQQTANSKPSRRHPFVLFMEWTCKHSVLLLIQRSWHYIYYQWSSHDWIHTCIVNGVGVYIYNERHCYCHTAGCYDTLYSVLVSGGDGAWIKRYQEGVGTCISGVFEGPGIFLVRIL